MLVQAGSIRNAWDAFEGREPPRSPTVSLTPPLIDE